MTELPTVALLARKIDHSVLAAQAGHAELAEAAAVALRWGVASLCVKPCHVRPAAELLADGPVRVAAVVSFPHGADVSEVKAAQARAAVEAGAGELDMVLNIAALRDGDLSAVEADIRAVTAAAGRATVKVILECALLSDAEKLAACGAAERAGAGFVKTSTGFAAGGATADDVSLLRRSVSVGIGVKASGGIRTLNDALKMLAAGATRLGTSSTDAILRELQSRLGQAAG